MLMILSAQRVDIRGNLIYTEIIMEDLIINEKHEIYLASIAAEAVSSVPGVSSPAESKKHRNVQAYLFENTRVMVDANINIDFGYSVKDVAYSIQTIVKKNIESRTKFTVENVNVNIIGVVMPIN